MTISSEIERLQTAKADIKTSIEGKGVTVPSATKLDGYPSLINSIPTGITPTGTISITQNGITDVTNYANADVNVSGGGGDDSFQKLVNGSIVTVNIPSGTTRIRGYAFRGCSSLVNITIPSSVTNIEEYAFYACASLEDITIPSGVTTLADYLFYGCDSLVSVIIPSGVTRIGNYVFQGCSNLTSITIPDNVTNIGSGTFWGCSGLTSVVVPSGISSIPSGFLRNCSSLASITIKRSTPPSVGSNALNNVPENANIYVPASAVNDYKTHSAWSSRASYIQAIPE